MNGKVFDIDFMLQAVPQVLAYLPVTLEIAAVSFVLGLVLAFLIALTRFFEQAINQQWGTELSVNGIPPTAFAVIALSMNGAAFMSETIRSAMLSVSEDQIEACYSVNMTRWQAVRYVVLPQAAATALAPLGNTAISMLKDTSLVFNISVVEMMAEAKIVGARAFRFFEVYIVVSLIYWVCCFVLERLIAVLERRSRHFERSVTAR